MGAIINSEIKDIGHFSDRPDHGIDREGINENILIYCIGGKGTLDIDGNTINVGPGDLFIIRENAKHGYFSDKIDPWNIYWVHYKGEVENYFSEWNKTFKSNVIKIGYHFSLISTFEDMLDDISKTYDQYSSHSASLRLNLFLISLLRLGSYGNTRFDEIISFMRKNVAANHSVDEFAQMANISKYHFIREFKKYTGINPMSYFKKLKMEFACDLLSNTESTIALISNELNFSSPYHFSESFKNEIGVRPKEFRNMKNKNKS